MQKPWINAALSSRGIARLMIVGVWLTTGCLSVPPGSEGGPDASMSGCKNVDFCSLVTLDDVNAALGGSFNDIEPGFKGDTGPDIFSDSCWYRRPPQEELTAQRDCFVDAAAASADFVEILLGPPASFGASTAVSGVGDKAVFVVVGSDGGQQPGPALYVLAGHVVLAFNDFYGPVRLDSEQGLVELASKALAH